ncbi:glycosyltransferase family 4 protein [Thiorhodococcus minor]|uniref:Glycosyltransferase n=1 Tax=Thiorhodococcus minor TaxID=57489 RepID=A0A6M0JWW9_9GAMM|nr:glycosyltransferase [Thiorhodococcus minor]NEV61113.1 glycosyltransferase [Thiorhodococcus minor]
MIPSAIHQFSIACHAGDGITNGMLLTRRLLRHAGIPSEIYCEECDAPLREETRPFDDYVSRPDQILLIHHGIGNGVEERLRRLADRCLMVFHNITPAEFFDPEDPIQPMLALGWRQVADWKAWLDGAIADSEQNLELLLRHGYDREGCEAIPLLVDLERLGAIQPQHACRPLDDGFRLLFVGRVMPHKNQLGLVETLDHLRRMTGRDARLTLVGNPVDAAYLARLEQEIRDRGLEQAVTLTGRVDEAELARHFQQADLYVSLSHHEGFGMPLIEAMANRLPVLAYNPPESNVDRTVDGGGLLLERDDPLVCAACIAELMDSPRLRARMVDLGERHLESFQPQRLYERLARFLAKLDIQLPRADFHSSRRAPLKYRIEGPFDSSYSLAIVNRNLAKALAARHPEAVGLYATEGPGDLVPDAGFLRAEPLLEELYRAGCDNAVAEATLRLLYPPRVTGMKGLYNGLACYGWEESLLPWETVSDFNQHLQWITTMSHYVSRVLIDNGVSLPVHRVGIGADHILRAQPDPGALPRIKQGFKLLHISSCFPRKGVDVLLKAYAEAFSADDDVTLIIKTFPNPHHDIARQLAQWRKTRRRAPHVTLINRDLADGAIRALYQLSDVLVAPSRGEGFGLPMAEAMLHQLPVITTGYGGQSDFCTEETSWLLDYQFARARTHMGQSASLWVEPDADQLARLLGEFHRHHREGTLSGFTAEKRERAYDLVARDFTWDAVAARVDGALDRERRRPLFDPKLSLGCITTWNSKCGIAVYSRKLLSAMLDRVVILANDDATLTATDSPHKVERCWTSGQRDNLKRLEHSILRAGLSQVLIQFNFAFFRLDALKRLLGSLRRNGIQTLITFHSTADVNAGEETLSLRSLLPELQHCTRIFVHGVQDLNRLKSWGLSANCTLFPHGVDPDRSTTRNDPPAWLAGKRIIASYGFLLPHKGIPQLIEAFASLHAKRPDTHLLLLNAEYPIPESREVTAHCERLIRKLGLHDDVTLINDYLEDGESLAWLSLAEMIVFAYQRTQESSSAAVRWGLATGRPVLCTPLDIFEDVADAVHFLAGTSPSDIRSGVEALLRDPRRQAELQARQQAWLEQHDWARLSRRLANLCTAIRLNAADATAVDRQAGA